VIEVDKCIFRPELLAQIIARYNLARMLQEYSENAALLFLKLDLATLLAQFAGAQIEFKKPKSDKPGRFGCGIHGFYSG
jgi:hypothetical protein